MENNLGGRRVQNKGFSHFFKVASLVFLDIAQDCSLGQCLTSSRDKTSKKIFVAQMEGSTQTCLFQLKIFQKTRKLSKMINLKQVKQKFVILLQFYLFFNEIKTKLSNDSTAKDEKVRHGQLAAKLFSILRHSVHPFCWTGWGEGGEE